MSKANLFWYQSTNFGDMLSPYLLGKFLKIPIDQINYVDHDHPDPKYILTGSILSVENIRNAKVFGTGFVFSNNYFVGKNILIAGVRGNMSLQKIRQEKDLHGNTEIVISDDVVIGEPSLCLPYFYNPAIPKKFKLGVIPHLFDYEKARQMYSHDADISIIDLAQHPGQSIEQSIESIIVKILQCEFIISSSLHGLIVAIAYGIRAQWCEFNKGSLIGDRFKFYDFLDSITSVQKGNEYIKPINLISQKRSVEEIVTGPMYMNEKIDRKNILYGFGLNLF